MDIGATSLMSLPTSRPASESAREDRLKAAAEAKLRDARAAVDTLKRLRSQASEERKAIARQKIEQLKARLQALKAMAAVDPKGTARMAGQLARELGAAVKAYAAAGGVTSGMDSGAVPVPGEGGATAPAPPAGEGDAALSGAKEPSPEAAAQTAAGATAQADDEQGSDHKNEAEKAANPYQRSIDQANARAAEMTRRSSEKQADSDFLAEVRNLAAEIKQLVRRAAENKPGDEDVLPPDEARKMKAMAEQMDRDIKQASIDLGGGLSLLV